MYTKKNTQASKASQVTTKKIEILAKKIVAIAAISITSNNQASQILEFQANVSPNLDL